MRPIKDCILNLLRLLIFQDDYPFREGYGNYISCFYTCLNVKYAYTAHAIYLLHFHPGITRFKEIKVKSI